VTKVVYKVRDYHFTEEEDLDQPNAAADELRTIIDSEILTKLKEASMTNQLALRYFKIADDVADLTYSSGMAACFDVAANESVAIEPGQVAIIGTGIKMDIPEGYSVRLHPRSGTGSKRRLGMPHSVGIIDADYILEVKIAIANEGSVQQVINRGDRIAQAELVYSPQVALVQSLTEPPVKTARIGGFGSSGI
jgi:dUTP pyrophosphatase